MNNFLSQKEIEFYHERYMNLYRECINLFLYVTFDNIKAQCIEECKKIKRIWTKTYNFNIDELTCLEPEGMII